MKKFNLFVLLNIILFLSSCGTIKEGFGSQKKNNSDEFLVEKKSPLIMPPDYNELPIPQEKNLEKKSEESQIENLISKSEKDGELADKPDDKNKSFEDLLLEKIKKN
jgi:CRISPR/Cas system-associated protein Cas5 (RAMP superfamily)